MRGSPIRRILVVDDEAQYRQLVHHFLEADGYHCVMAQDAQQALEIIRRDPVDLVISDILMKDKDGLELLREATSVWPHPDFIMMTGHTENYQYSAIIEAGAADFIAKPFEISELRAKIARIQNERNILHELRQTNQALSLEVHLNAAVAELAKALMGTLSMEEISSLVLDHAIRLTGSLFGYVGYTDWETGQLQISTFTENVLEVCRVAGKDTALKQSRGLCGWVLQNHEPVLSNSPLEHAESSGLPEGHPPIRRFLSVPVIDGEKLLGQISLANAEKDYTEADIAVVKRIAVLFALAIQRKWGLDELHRTGDYLENVIESATEAIGIIDRRGRAVRWNQAAVDLFGYSLEELREKSIFDIYADPAQLAAMQNELRRRGFVKRYEIDVCKKNGEISPFELSISLIKNEQQETIASIGVAMDLGDLKQALTKLRTSHEHLEMEIAERERVEEELRRSEQRLRLLIDSVAVGIVIVDAERHIIVEANPFALEMFGATKETMLGKHCCNTICFNRQDQCPITDLAMGVFRAEGGMRRVDGSRIPVLKTAIPVVVDGRQHILETFMDISERVRLEERLREAYNETENFLASISSILIGLTLDHHVTRWNVVAEKTLGLSREDAVGRHLGECPVPWEWNTIREALEKSAVDKKTIRLNESRYLTPNGKEGFLSITVSPILKDNNELSGFLVLGGDVTERRILEAQLVQAQKLESIGQLAAGIAHEINTPTQYVGDNIRFLQDSFTDLHLLLDEYHRLFEAAKSQSCAKDLIAGIEAVARQIDIEYLQDEMPLAISQSLDGVERVSRIVRAMKSFSHPGTEEKTLLDINQALDSTVTVARNEWKYAADLETQFDPDLPRVLGLPAELNQVFLNIIVNAAHAISDVVGDGSNGKGLITVKTGVVDEAVEVHISDTGTGIPVEIRDRIFDPFYTTKEVGRGTGQGLAIARSVVADQHGGSITVESEMGMGTTFIIRLPVASAQGE